MDELKKLVLVRGRVRARCGFGHVRAREVPVAVAYPKSNSHMNSNSCAALASSLVEPLAITHRARTKTRPTKRQGHEKRGATRRRSRANRHTQTEPTTDTQMRRTVPGSASGTCHREHRRRHARRRLARREHDFGSCGRHRLRLQRTSTQTTGRSGK